MPGTAPVTIITRVLPNVPTDDIPAIYSMLTDAGCMVQRDLLVSAAAADADEMQDEAAA